MMSPYTGQLLAEAIFNSAASWSSRTLTAQLQ
jgi:hypothetical protein